MSKVSLLSKDFAKLREELIKKIPELTDKWTDFSESDIGITLLELVAGVGEMLSFYLDRNVNECFLINARQRKNVVALAKSLGYEIKSSTASTGKVRITITPELGGTDIGYVLKKFAVFTTTGEKAVKFFSIEDVDIVGSGAEIPVVQGEKGEQKETSTGEADMEFIILESKPVRLKPIAFNYVAVYVNDELWERVDTLIFSGEEDKHYVVEEDYEGIIKVKFGDGKCGKIPVEGDEIKIIYSKTDCVNVGANTIKILDDFILEKNEGGVKTELTDFPDGYAVSITNPEPCSGGKKEETIEEIKQEAPLIFASAGRVVTKNDYAGWILKNPGVLKVVVWGEAEESPPNYDLCNYVRYCILPYPLPDCEVGEEETNPNLIAEIEEDLYEKSVVGVKLKHIQFNYVDIDISISAEVDRKYSLVNVKNIIINKVKDILNPLNRDLGQDVLVGEFYKEISAVEGVKSFVITSLKRSEPVKGDSSVVDLSDSVNNKELFKWEIARAGEIEVAVDYFFDKFSGEVR